MCVQQNFKLTFVTGGHDAAAAFTWQRWRVIWQRAGFDVKQRYARCNPEEEAGWQPEPVRHRALCARRIWEKKELAKNS